MLQLDQQFLARVDEVTDQTRATTLRSLQELIYTLRREPEPPREVLRVVCAWCQSVQTEGTPDAQTSHTICAGCMSKHFPDA